LATKRDVAVMLGVPLKDLIFWIHRRQPQYRVFAIPKRSGGVRQISAPEGAVRRLQERLLPVLTAVYAPRDVAHGFIAARSIRTNAAVHLGQRLVLNVDLSDFFPSIHIGRVIGLFVRYGVGPDAAKLLGRICCAGTTLPQGACTSPVLSNLIAAPLDRALLEFAKTHRCKYTRYADDLTFSTSRDIFPESVVKVTHENGVRVVRVGGGLEAVVVGQKFAINYAKVRLRTRFQRQEVTGLVINRRLNVPREFVKRLQGMLHAWRKYGYAAAEAKFLELDVTRKARRLPPIPGLFRRVVIGKLSYIRMIKGEDDAVYLSLWNRLALVDRRYPTRVRSLREVESALWVVESTFDDGGPIPKTRQGTAFALEGHGIVTAAHCAYGRVVLYRRTKPEERFSGLRIRFDDERDIAVFQVPPTSWTAYLRRSETPRAIENGSVLHSAGYPDGPASAQITTGRLVRTQPRYGMLNLFPDFQTYKGASGSPLLDEKLKVCGIVLYGPSRRTPPGDPESLSSAILVDEIDLAPPYRGS
jgi:RNA-directed DNA polymerase